MTICTFTTPVQKLRFAEGDEGVFEGHAAVWDVPNAFNEVMQRGAFAKSIKQRAANGGVALLWSHNPGEPIGSFTELREDDRGLFVRAKLVTETTRGREALALLKAKAVSGLSIGFTPVADKRGPNNTRLVTEVDLREISIVTLPAADGARITQVRSRQVGMRRFTEAVRRAALEIKECGNAPPRNSKPGRPRD